MHAIHNQLLKTEKCIHINESVFGKKCLSYYLNSIIKNTHAAGSVNLFICYFPVYISCSYICHSDLVALISQ